jgi:preprotein translocase subunit SecA
MLRIIDSLWIEHLTEMERMRVEASWESLRQIRPVDAYKNEGFKRFQTLLSTIQHDVAHTIYHVRIEKREKREQPPSPMTQVIGQKGGEGNKQMKVGSKKIGRNEPCPCGSGKKYKHCCGR